ncbi:hypothetical protein JJV70_03630 [Streptomyces sp. JJ66]|uniref:hypothetical protein n=1 Tax=Streptomyces sp. JJ66 TaxID=2803843 RepID=UPI001C56412E|nr:hypothetical protein [Streptomyces sp. JJ66]MBW1601208.1 hypothetical protein [Streptomyces sp. JJ66]
MGHDPYGVPMGATSDFKRAAETLTEFKKRVDGILDRLGESEAANSRLSSREVPKASYGTGFAEAEDLALQYEKVHTHLTNLSKTFGDQIEAMGIAVLGADIGFDNLEDDLKRRFWNIHQNTAQHSADGEQGEASTPNGTKSESL